MSIRNKLMLNLVAMAGILLLASNTIGGFVAERAGEDLIAEQVANRLESVRELKRIEIQDYFKIIEDQAVTFSESKTVKDLMVATKLHFYNFQDEIANKDLASMEKGLKGYYDNQFGTKYKRVNPGTNSSQSKLMSNLNANSVALQYHYISANPNPLGGKEAMDHPGDESAYSLAHKEYHPIVRSYLEHFGYYDIFLVDPDTGYIVYSVFKELDYATSLKNGPYANTGIAEAFRLANASNASGDYFLTEFEPYTPSHEDFASFISTPVIENGKKTGILIFQMPVDRIDHLMTNDHDWKEAGLGVSGESYLVDKNGKILNTSRLLYEKGDQFFDQLTASGGNAREIAVMRAKESTIGHLTVASGSTELAAQGKKGVHIHDNYLGTEVISAYMPIDVAGIKWNIISEISVAEAHEPATALTKSIASRVAWVLLAMLGVAYAAVWWFTGRLTNPIDKFSNSIEKIEHDSDLSHNIEVKKNDVTRDMAHSVNRMLEKFNTTVSGISDVSETLNESSSHVLGVTRQSNKIVHDQKEQTATVTQAMQQMSSINHGVASNATDALEAAKVADQEAHSGRSIVKQTAHA